MVQYVKGGPSRGALHGALLGEAAGQGLGEVIGTHYANKALDAVINDPELKAADPATRMSAIERALSPHGKQGERLLARRLQIEQQAAQQYKDQQALARKRQSSGILSRILSGEEVSAEEQAMLEPSELIQAKKALTTGSGKTLKDSLTDKELAEWQNAMAQEGMSDSEITMMKHSTPGVAQALYKDFLENRKRGQERSFTPDVTKATTGEVAESFDWETVKLPEGYTPADLVKDRNQNKKDIKPFVEKARDMKSANKGNKARFNILTNLNDSGKLPSGQESWMIDSDGNVRYTAQLLGKANPETERYVKTLNEFIKGAKEFFGSRVTNFDLDSYLKTLPNLLTSEEGRRVILEQMKLFNDWSTITADAEIQGAKAYDGRAPLAFYLDQVDRNLEEIDKQFERRLEIVGDVGKAITTKLDAPERFVNKTLLISPAGKPIYIDDEQVEFFVNEKGWDKWQ